MDIPLFEGQVQEAELTSEQVACLASSARAEVYWNCSTRIPRSISEIATAIGRSAAATTYHINELARVGLLIPVGERKQRSRVEKLYILRARRGFVSRDLGSSPEYDALILDGYNALLRLMSREREAYQSALQLDSRLRGTSSWRRQSTQVVATRAAEFSRRITQLMREFAAEPTDEDGIRVTFSYFMSPTLGETRQTAREAAKPRIK